MKKKMKLVALILSLTLICCCCNNAPADDDDTPSISNNDTNVNTPNENQSKLDVLRPAAYSNINDLVLEPGSYISIIGRYDEGSYWEEVEEGANQAIEDINEALGYKGDDKIKLNFSAPDICDDVDEQINILDEELARYPLAICMSAIDTTACAVQFDLAAENSIPIITFDSGSDYQNITAHISTNNTEAAQTAAEKLAALMGGTGEVAVFVQDSLSMTAKYREQAFIENLTQNYPDISVVDVYHLDELEDMAKQIAEEKNAAITEEEKKIDPSTFTQVDIIQYILEKNPNLSAVYATNEDTTQLVANVLNSLEKDDLYFVGFDGGEEQLELLENEVVDGLVVQNPYGMGYATVVAAARTILDLGNEAVIDSGYTWVTKENMNDPEIEKMLYQIRIYEEKDCFMKKKTLIFSICAVIVLVLLIGVFLYYHPTHYKFNHRFIIGNTAEKIIEKYGEFSKSHHNEAGEITYGTYMLRDNTPELIMSFDDSLWYEVYFENGIAVKVRLKEGWYGG